MPHWQQSLGVIGAFALLLGAGLVLDADRTWLGATLMAMGGVCVVAKWRHERRS